MYKIYHRAKRGAESRKRLTAPRVCVGAAMVLLRSRTPFLREKVICIGCMFSCPESRINQGCFRPYRVTRARRFLMRSAACRFVIRFRQSGQYLT